MRTENVKQALTKWGPYTPLYIFGLSLSDAITMHMGTWRGHLGFPRCSDLLIQFEDNLIQDKILPVGLRGKVTGINIQ